MVETMPPTWCSSSFIDWHRYATHDEMGNNFILSPAGRKIVCKNLSENWKIKYENKEFQIDAKLCNAATSAMDRKLIE